MISNAVQNWKVRISGKLAFIYLLNRKDFSFYTLSLKEEF